MFNAIRSLPPGQPATTPPRHHANAPGQLLKYIPRSLVNAAAARHGVGAKRKGRRLLHRYKVRAHAVDSTTIELVANCMDWARHRRRKAAAKLHLRLEVSSSPGLCHRGHCGGKRQQAGAGGLCRPSERGNRGL